MTVLIFIFDIYKEKKLKRTKMCMAVSMQTAFCSILKSVPQTEVNSVKEKCENNSFVGAQTQT